MSTERADTIRWEVTRALAGLLPSKQDDAWIERLVGPSRFGWDWEALERGFFEPFHRWAGDRPARTRPVLAGLVIEALGEPSGRYADVLAILELEHLAAIMLDEVRNTRDLGGADTDAVELPMPTWVTIAYNVRQLVPVLIARQECALSPDRRRWLSQRCARFLFRQGIGITLDLWGSEHALDQPSPDGFVAHLRLYVGNLSFGLACDFAAAAARLDFSDADRLRRAGIELGVAYRLAALAAEPWPAFRANSLANLTAGRVTEQTVRWRQGIDPGDLPALADRAQERALTLARDVDPAVADAFAAFLAVCEIPALKGDRS
jgi:hypothetical protein